MTLDVTWLVLGLVGLVLGADVALGAARRAARRWGVSELVVGLTIASVGTSAPELATTAGGALFSAGEGGADAAGVAVGNIIGSNMFLLSALLGIVALVNPLPVGARALRRDGWALVLSTMLVGSLLAFDRVVGRLDGLVLVLSYVGYLAWLVIHERRHAARRRTQEVEDYDEAVADAEAVVTASPVDRAPPSEGLDDEGAAPRWARIVDVLPGPLWLHDSLVFAAGIGVLVFGADVVVQRGVSLARVLGVSGTLVGILVGVGTSLPELVVSIRAAASKALDLTFGNIVGSAIANLLLCLGVAGLVQPLPVPDVARAYDLPFTGAITLVALLLMGEQSDVSRREGGALIVLFVLYVFVRVAWVQ